MSISETNNPSLARSVSATSNTIEEIGYPTDIRKAIAEYIWNGFDASASVVSLDYKIQAELGYIESLSITDNGTGITYEDLDTTFKPILDSPKKESSACFYTRGKRGKGRFSFLSFSTQSLWETVYGKDNECYKYTIQIANSQKNQFLPTTPRKVDPQATGTKVVFQNFKEKLTSEFLEGSEFSDFLKSEFGWFLHLHSSSNYRLLVNGVELDFKSIIQDSDTREEIIEDEDGRSYRFSFYYILWTGKIGEDSQNYYLNSKSNPQLQEDNKTNRKGDSFFNSLYIVSDFFDNFELLDKKTVKGSNGDASVIQKQQLLGDFQGA